MNARTILVPSVPPATRRTFWSCAGDIGVTQRASATPHPAAICPEEHNKRIRMRSDRSLERCRAGSWGSSSNLAPVDSTSAVRLSQYANLRVPALASALLARYLKRSRKADYSAATEHNLEHRLKVHSSAAVHQSRLTSRGCDANASR